MMFRSTEISLSPVNSADPVSISKNMHPADHTSTSAPYFELPSSSSGGLHKRLQLWHGSDISSNCCLVHADCSKHVSS